MEISSDQIDLVVERLLAEVVNLHKSDHINAGNAESVLKCMAVASERLAQIGALYELAIEPPPPYKMGERV